MFVGHFLLAFALVAWGADRLGVGRDRALALGGVAGAFAAVPDVDIAYALVGPLGAAGGPLARAEAFWSAGNLVHRGVTHSLVVAVPTALAAGLWARATPASRSLSAGIVLAVAGSTLALDGALTGAVALLFGAAALSVSGGARRYAGLQGRTVGALAFVGLASHPFGDLLTGEPPAMLYPFDAALVGERIALSADPTLHLLGAFGAELATAWAALFVLLSLYGVGLRGLVANRAGAGAGYAGAAFLLPAPTLELSYPFVFSVLAVGLFGALSKSRPRFGRGTVRLPDGSSAAATGLAALTLAWAAYGVVYLAVGAGVA